MADPDFDFDYYGAAQYLNAAASAAASDKGAVNDPIHLSLCDAVYIGQENNEPSGPEHAPEQFAPGDVEEDEDDDEGDRYFCEPLDELLLPPANFHSSQFDLLPENTGFHTSIGEFDPKWENSYFIDPSVLAIQEPQLYATTQPTEPLIATGMEQMATQVDMDDMPVIPVPRALPQAVPQTASALPAAINESLPEPLELEPLEAVPQLSTPVASPGMLTAKTEPQTPAPLAASAPVTLATPSPLPVPAVALRTVSEDSCDDNATDTDYTPNNSAHSSMQSFGAAGGTTRKRVKTRRAVPSKLAKRDKYVCSLADASGVPCGKTFGRPYDLERHLDIHNPNRRTHYCKYCPGQDKLFSRADALTRHIKNKHGREE